MIRARSQAREAALQALYQLDQRGDLGDVDVEELVAGAKLRPEALTFALRLVRGVREQQELIDAELEAVAINWNLERMAVIDRNVLRLGAYELLHLDDIPAPVTLDEMVTLAKKFSTKDSGAFVNGILDKVHRRHQAPAQSGGEASD
jgi:transcription antitermination factor NusB